MINTNDLPGGPDESQYRLPLTGQFTGRVLRDFALRLQVNGPLGVSTTRTVFGIREPFAARWRGTERRSLIGSIFGNESARCVTRPADGGTLG